MNYMSMHIDGNAVLGKCSAEPILGSPAGGFASVWDGRQSLFTFVKCHVELKDLGQENSNSLYQSLPVQGLVWLYWPKS